MADRLAVLLARGLAVRLVWWCRPVRDSINRWLRPYQGELSAAEKAAYVGGQLDDCFRRAGVAPESLRGQTVLEIGPGGNFGLAAALLALGAARVVCVDRDQLCFDGGIDEGLYRELDSRLAGKLAPVVERSGQRCRLSPERFEYRFGAPIEEVPFPDGSFDFVFSCACLEHVYDPALAIRQMRRVLRPGGRMLHQVDFRDHRDFARPLEFLRYSEPVWRWIALGSYTNRWRVSQFRVAFEEAGFEILAGIATGDDVNGPRARSEYVAALRPHLHARFRSVADDDLFTLGTLFLCQRVD